MRSETAPFWVGFVLGLGVALIAVAVLAMATGRMKITRNNIIRRDEKPGAFWGWIAAELVIGVAALAYAIPHFGPGG
jgi:uncharacterized membrane protein YidH (DUF202 family)